jgi:GTP-binding protein
MLDDELLKELKKIAPKDRTNDGEKVPVIFISSVAMKGIEELKDVLWRMLN